MRAVLQWSAFDPARGKWAAGCTRDHPDSLSCKRVVGPGVGNTIALPAYSNEPAADLVVLSCRQASYAASCRHRHTQEPGCGYAANPVFNCRSSTSQHCWRWSCQMVTACQRAASATGTTPHRATRRLLHGKHPRVVPADQLRVLRSSRQPS